jgi:hypothetical protein
VPPLLLRLLVVVVVVVLRALRMLLLLNGCPQVTSVCRPTLLQLMLPCGREQRVIRRTRQWLAYLRVGAQFVT